jgi:hypothetical protein
MATTPIEAIPKPKSPEVMETPIDEGAEDNFIKDFIKEEAEGSSIYADKPHLAPFGNTKQVSVAVLYKFIESTKPKRPTLLEYLQSRELVTEGTPAKIGALPIPAGRGAAATPALVTAVASAELPAARPF